MLCNSCNKREAAVIVQMSVNGQMMSRNLCPACAQQMHIEIAKSLARAGTVLDTLKKRADRAQSQKPAPEVPEAICSNCGHAIRALTGNSRMGCAQCYDGFRERIAAVIAPGTVPVQDEAPKNKRREMHRQLEQALVNENYELAAVLRDRLRESAREGDTGV